jgi:hypothetical protein
MYFCPRYRMGKHSLKPFNLQGRNRDFKLTTFPIILALKHLIRILYGSKTWQDIGLATKIFRDFCHPKSNIYKIMPQRAQRKQREFPVVSAVKSHFRRINMKAPTCYQHSMRIKEIAFQCAHVTYTTVIHCRIGHWGTCIAHRLGKSEPKMKTATEILMGIITQLSGVPRGGGQGSMPPPFADGMLFLTA